MSYSLAFYQAVMTVLFVTDKIRLGMFDFVPTKEIASALNIANPSLVKIVQGLNRQGVIETREGAKGGIRLAKSADKLTLLDIFLATEAGKPLFRSDHAIQAAGPRPARVRASVKSVLDQAESELHKSLKNITLQRLLDKAAS